MHTYVYTIDPANLAGSRVALAKLLDSILDDSNKAFEPPRDKAAGSETLNSKPFNAQRAEAQRAHVEAPVTPPEPIQEAPAHDGHVLKTADFVLLERIRVTGAVLEDLFTSVVKHLDAQFEAVSPAERQRIYGAAPQYFSRLAKQELQTGLMYLERAIKQPSGF